MTYTNRFKRVSDDLCKRSTIGFILNAVLTGVFTDTFVLEYFGIENNISPNFKIDFYIFSIYYVLLFEKIISDDIRKTSTANANNVS